MLVLVGGLVAGCGGGGAKTPASTGQGGVGAQPTSGLASGSALPVAGTPAPGAKPTPGRPAGVAVVGGRAVPLSVDPSHPPERDVAISACDPVEPRAWPRAVGSVVNRSTTKADYSLSIGFFGSTGAQVGSATTSLAGLRPGGTSTWTATSLRSAQAPVSCRVLSVSRTVSYS